MAVYDKGWISKQYRLRVGENFNTVSFGELLGRGAKFSVHRHTVELGVRDTSDSTTCLIVSVGPVRCSNSALRFAGGRKSLSSP